MTLLVGEPGLAPAQPGLEMVGAGDMRRPIERVATTVSDMLEWFRGR